MNFDNNETIYLSIINFITNKITLQKIVNVKPQTYVLLKLENVLSHNWSECASLLKKELKIGVNNW